MSSDFDNSTVRTRTILWCAVGLQYTVWRASRLKKQVSSVKNSKWRTSSCHFTCHCVLSFHLSTALFCWCGHLNLCCQQHDDSNNHVESTALFCWCGHLNLCCWQHDDSNNHVDTPHPVFCSLWQRFFSCFQDHNWSNQFRLSCFFAVCCHWPLCWALPEVHCKHDKAHICHKKPIFSLLFTQNTCCSLFFCSTVIVGAGSVEWPSHEREWILSFHLFDTTKCATVKSFLLCKMHKLFAQDKSALLCLCLSLLSLSGVHSITKHPQIQKACTVDSVLPWQWSGLNKNQKEVKQVPLLFVTGQTQQHTKWNHWSHVSQQCHMWCAVCVENQMCCTALCCAVLCCWTARLSQKVSQTAMRIPLSQNQKSKHLNPSEFQNFAWQRIGCASQKGAANFFRRPFETPKTADS